MQAAQRAVCPDTVGAQSWWVHSFSRTRPATGNATCHNKRTNPPAFFADSATRDTRPGADRRRNAAMDERLRNGRN